MVILICNLINCILKGVKIDMYYISFKDNEKKYLASSSDDDINIGDYVVVLTEKGEYYAKVVQISDKVEDTTNYQIIRKASEEDYNSYLSNLKLAKEVLIDARKLADKYNLVMRFVSAEFNLDKSLLFVNYTSDDRVDFREFVKSLAAKYKTRIELRQIGIRDKAKIVCGLGMCGMPLCCSKVLDKIDTVTINMAKNQYIALNPNKINGVCGRLLCCLAYEDDTYSRIKDKLPQIGSSVKYEGKNYKVVSINVLKNSYTIDIDGEEKEIVVSNEE